MSRDDTDNTEENPSLKYNTGLDSEGHRLGEDICSFILKNNRPKIDESLSKLEVYLSAGTALIGAWNDKNVIKQRERLPS
jgi:hypothetical protein